ncbi:aminotransferase [Rhizobium sp. CCGE 510]|nr:aminotransferase [Rhizobium sp. CCGE 510]
MSQLAERDVKSLFHGQTDARKLEATGPLVCVRAEGINVFDEHGNGYIDTLASMWNVALGYSEQRLIEGAKRQLETLPAFHSYYNRSHPPAIDLAERLTAMAPGGMSKAYFTNSGSEANETAVKIVRFYNNALGRPEKKKIIARQQAYHGAGIFSGSLTGLKAIHEGFDLPSPGVLRTAFPYQYPAQSNISEEEFATSLAELLESLILSEGPDTIAAFIGEPILGSGGVYPPPATYWEKVQAVLRKYDILLIVDEVITGFGRTGPMFGSELYGLRPDLLVLSKQITSGYAALGAVLFTDEIYQVVADYTSKLGTFGHAFTSGCHPVPIAIALETLDIIEERKILEHVQSIAPHFEERVRRFSTRGDVVDVRCVGLLAAIELRHPEGIGPGVISKKAVDIGTRHGLLLRASGNSIAICPPLIITTSELDTMFDRLEATFDELASETT